jgi:hypothetical protein
MNHAVILATAPSNEPDELGGSPGSSQSLLTNSQPHDQIQVLLHGSLDPLLSSEGSSVESLSLGRSDPLLLSDALSLGGSEPLLGGAESDVESLLSDGWSLSLPDESPTLGSSLVLGRSLSEPSDPESLVDREVESEPEPLNDVGTLVESSLLESLPETEVLVDRESEPDPLPDAELLWLPLAEALFE